MKKWSSSSNSSTISPTISSRISSRVTIPEVPPYSSITIARCTLFFWNSWSNAFIFFVSGTKNDGLITDCQLNESPLWLCGRISFTYNIPLMLSKEPENTGILENPESIITFSTSEKLAFMSSETTSILGFIISETFLLPNFTISSRMSFSSADSVSLFMWSTCVISSIEIGVRLSEFPSFTNFVNLRNNRLNGRNSHSNQNTG